MEDDDDNSSSSSSSILDVVVEVPWRHAIHAYYDIIKLDVGKRLIHGMMLVGCCSERCLYLLEGWSDYFLHDLKSMRRFSLPHFEESEDQFWCANVLTALTAEPNDPDCEVLHIDSLDLKVVFYRLHDPQQVIYRQQLPYDLKIGGRYFEQVSWVTWFRGQIYFFTHPLMRLFRVEVAATTASSIQIVLLAESMPSNLKRFCQSGAYSSFHLLQFCDDLLLIHVSKNLAASTVFEFEDIQLYRLDNESKTWMHMIDIGDNVIFLTPHCACYKSIAHLPCPAKRNSIYYLTDNSADETLYIFDLQDGSITPHMPNKVGDAKPSVLHWLSA